MFTSLISNTLQASNDKDANKSLDKSKPDNIVYQQVIEEASSYFASLPESVRNEIETFRLDIAKLYTQKSEKYKSLSPAAKAVLQKDKEFKKKLPLNLRKEVGKLNNNTNKN